jgi:predicted DNA binding CopG/RHH family protein
MVLAMVLLTSGKSAAGARSGSQAGIGGEQGGVMALMPCAWLSARQRHTTLAALEALPPDPSLAARRVCGNRQAHRPPRPLCRDGRRSASEDHHSQPQGNPSQHLGNVIMQATPSLEPEEQQLLNDFEAGSLRSVASPQLLTQLRAAARSTGQKDQRINIQLSSPDLQALRARALQEGILIKAQSFHGLSDRR